MTGASSGIGAAYAQRLAARGHDLVLVARREDRLRTVADRVAAEGAAAEVLAADLADDMDLARVEARLSSGVYGLVNNAGFGARGPFAQGDIDRFDSMLRLNVRAVLRLTHAALPPMLKAAEGVVVNVGSGAVFRQIPGYAAYIAAKAFVTEFTSALTTDHGDSGVRFQLAVPGVTRTEFAQVAAGDGHAVSLGGAMSPEDFVDAALQGLDRGEDVSIPAMEDPAVYAAFLDARKTVGRHITSPRPAARYAAGPIQG